MVLKPEKLHSSKQRYQDFHDRAQSFALCSDIMHELSSRQFPGHKIYCVLHRVKGTEHTTKNLVGLHSHYLY